MIFGIGVDIAEVARFAGLIDRFGDRIAKRILTADEFAQFVQRERSHKFLASRFAAKEAVAKALGTGIYRQGIGFHSIQVTSNPAGKPEVGLSGGADSFARAHHITGMHLSLSDEKHYCVAMAVLESE